MLTIQTQNLESTELSHKVKIFIFLTILIVLSIIAIIVCLNFSTDRYSAKIYDNPESVEKLFIDNQEEFFKVSCILKNSELFSYLYSIDRKSIFSPSIPKKEKYLNDSEYEDICTFLNEYRPYEIGLTGCSIHFVFLCQNEDVVVYYTEEEGEALSKFLQYVSQDSKVKSINDNWYLEIRSSDTTR